MNNQLPPADELAQIRARMKADEAREAELKALLISDPSSRTGNHYLAQIKEIEKRRPNMTGLKEMYPEVYAEILMSVRETRVELRGIDNETGEIVSLQRAAALKTLRIV